MGDDVGQDGQAAAGSVGDSQDGLDRRQGGVQVFGVGVNDRVEEYEKYKEGNAGCVKQGVLAPTIRHFRIQGDECRRSGEHSVNLGTQSGNLGKMKGK